MSKEGTEQRMSNIECRRVVSLRSVNFNYLVAGFGTRPYDFSEQALTANKGHILTFSVQYSKFKILFLGLTLNVVSFRAVNFIY